MSNIYKASVVAATSLALGGGLMVAGAPAASATPADGARVLASGNRVLPSVQATVRFGQKNSTVRRLQAALSRVGLGPGVSGYFGPVTESKVKSYQYSRGLRVTGVADSATWAALNSGKPAVRKAIRYAVRKVSAAKPGARVAASGRAAAAVRYAYSKLGTPYVWGGNGPYGFDCSGLTSAAWRAAGVSIPRTSYAQWYGLRKVSRSSLRPGDIVVFYGGGHVGIYIGGGKVIHAPGRGQRVKVGSVGYMSYTAAVRPA